MIIREAKASDCKDILKLIKQLAVYERAPEAVIVTEEQLKIDGFGENPVYKCFVADSGSEVVGFALVYFRYSTWKGKCVYLEDFVVDEAQRGQGIGKQLFQKVIDYTLDCKCYQLVWQVLDWNEPAINFYNKYNSTLDGEWINGTLTVDQLKVFAKN
ncbi:MAG: GNAT superfamily N-acetyltransferase [Sphingobacteriales bacterium]|jgi:GNAT superfamily N-acetyltransferase